MAFASLIFPMARATFTKSWLWHQCLSHLNFDTINDLAKNDLVTGLPKFKYHKEHLCPSCEQKIEKGISSPHPNQFQIQKQKVTPVFIYDEVQKYQWKAVCLSVIAPKMIVKEHWRNLVGKGLDLTYAPSTITSQKPTEHELELLFEAMYDDYIGGQPSASPRTISIAQAPQLVQTPTVSTTTADTTPTLTNSSSQVKNIPNTSPDVDELETQQQHVQQNNQAPLQPKTVADNVLNAMFGNTFVNPFATSSTSAAESSSS
ncbi:retrovirus-related pol polyprotein from transposon TNT 1-94 [Tanacetum coccineum]|uniref:Retrovirus-related pol polyprotein from transposon TNT 1-94 n=1 Tax=Tanacetum coccineum TaxID=301880 RepID=A0ABQ4WHK7_9ASTR